MAYSFFGYGGVWGSGKWDVTLGRLDVRYSTSMYQEYLKDEVLTPAPTDGGYSTAAARAQIVTEDFANVSPYVNPENGNPASTSSCQVWGSTLEMLKLSKEAGYSVNSTATTVDELVIAQKQEWSQHETRALANKAALGALLLNDGQITTGPFEFTGTMPLPPVGTNDSNPTVGSTLTFGAEGMPAAPADTGGTTTHAGYMLTGEGTITESETAELITIKKTFTKRWHVEKVAGLTRVKHVKTRDYVVGRYKLTFSFGMDKDPAIWDMSTSVQQDFYGASFNDCMGQVVGSLAPGWWEYLPNGARFDYGPPFSYVGMNLYAYGVYNGNPPGVQGLAPGDWGSQIISPGWSPPESAGEYHTETVGGSYVDHVEVSAYSFTPAVGHYSIHADISGLLNTGYPYDGVGSTAEAAQANLCATIPNPNTITFPGYPRYLTYYGPFYYVGSIVNATSATYTNDQGETAPTDTSLPGGYGAAEYYLDSAAVTVPGTYIVKTGTRVKYIFTEETGIFGEITFIAKKRV